jgi:rubrerythrin
MLPKIDVPIYDLKLISNGKKIRYRPFTVKEEKLFLMALESNDSEATINTIKQVINNCVLDDVNVNTLPIFDIEYLFLHLRAKSIGEEIQLKYKCNNDVDKEEETKKCNNLVEFSFNILEIEPTRFDNHNNKIEITDKLGIVMKYPNFELIEKYKDGGTVENLISMIVGCIEYIYDAEELYYAKDSSEKELIEFVDSLQTKDLEKIKLFFDTAPKLEKKLNFKCNKCGHEEEINLEGIQNFFG